VAQGLGDVVGADGGDVTIGLADNAEHDVASFGVRSATVAGIAPPASAWRDLTGMYELEIRSPLIGTCHSTNDPPSDFRGGSVVFGKRKGAFLTCQVGSPTMPSRASRQRDSAPERGEPRVRF
jgi:hypothetical protein